MFHTLLRVWFGWVEDWGYPGVFVLMAMESSIIPVPSEIVMPPAAFWAAQGRMTFWGVVLAGTLGGYAGSAISYWGSRWLGPPLIRRYGRYVLISEEKVRLAHAWVSRFGVVGVFLARLLPVIRHLISIPAGILTMPFGRFSLATVAGAGLWCAILSWFGRKVIGGHPELLQSPEAMVAVIRGQLAWLAVAVLVLLGLYGLVAMFRRRLIPTSPPPS